MKTGYIAKLAAGLVLTGLFAGCSSAIQPEKKTVLPPAATSEAALEISPTLTSTLMATATSIPQPTPTSAPISCTIAFDTNRDGDKEIYSMNPDGSNVKNLSDNDGEDWNPVWSPDGKHIAFVSNRKNDKTEGQFIYIMDADGTHVRQLTMEGNSDFPDWSHDGKNITYANNDDIYVIAADGNSPSINLTNSPDKDISPAWSPDDRQIAWLSSNDGKWNIFVMNTDGSQSKQITDDGRINEVEWSVDGRIFTGGWDSKDHGCCNFVMNSDGSNVLPAGGKGEIQNYLPFWTLDGHRVECLAVSLNGKDNEIYVVGNIFPEIMRNLTNNPAEDLNPDWPANCRPAVEIAPSTGKTAQKPGNIVIGYAGDVLDQPQRKANFQKACDELGISCLYGDIASLLSQNVNAIVQNAAYPDEKMLEKDIAQAKEKGIPVILLNTESPFDGAYSLMVNEETRAAASMEWMFTTMHGRGDIAFLDFVPEKGHAAILAELQKKYPEVHIADQRTIPYDFEKIKSDVGDMMKSHPEIKAIWANKEMAGVIFGLADNTEIPSEKWPLMNCEPTKEGLFIWKDRLKEFPGMRCIAVSNPPGIAYDAVYAAYDLVNGRKINTSVLGGKFNRTIMVDPVIVTSNNLSEWMKKVEYEDATYILDNLMKPDDIETKWFLK